MKDVKKIFLKEVQFAFPIFQKNERRFYRDFESSVNAYTEQFPNYTIEDLHEQFGEPKDIANTYFNNMESSTYFALMKKNRYLKVISTSISVALLIFLLLSVGFWIDARRTFNENLMHVKEDTLEIYYNTAPTQEELP
jgi:hypothetical protein